MVSVDGGETELLKGPLWLPHGPHRIRAERGGFLPAERDVVVPPGGTASVDVVFEPTPEKRASYVEQAETRRTWSLVTMAAGAVMLGGGFAFAVIQNNKLPEARSELAAIEASFEPRAGGACDPADEHETETVAKCESQFAAAAAEVDDLEQYRTAGWVAAGVGGAVLVTGTLLLISGDDPHRYDETPASRALTALRVGPTPTSEGVFVSWAGSF